MIQNHKVKKMKSLIMLCSRIFGYIYMACLFLLFAGRIYGSTNLKNEYMGILICLAAPFLYGILVKLFVKAKNSVKLFRGGTLRKPVYTGVLFGVVVVCLILEYHFMRGNGIILSGGLESSLRAVWSDSVAFAQNAKKIIFFAVPFSAVLSVLASHRVADVRTALWLLLADSFLLSGIFLRPDNYVFFLFFAVALMLALQYFRLYSRELYGDSYLMDLAETGRQAKKEKTPDSKIRKKKPKRKNKKKKSKNKNLFSRLLSKRKKSRPKRVTSEDAYRQSDYDRKDRAVKVKENRNTMEKEETAVCQSRQQRPEQSATMQAKTLPSRPMCQEMPVVETQAQQAEENDIANIAQMLSAEAESEKEEAILELERKYDVNNM